MDSQPNTQDIGNPDEPLPEPGSPDALARTRVVVSVPAGTTEEERDAAAETLAVRAQAIAPNASIEVDGDTLTVVLPGVADDAVGEQLIHESILWAGQVVETRTPDHPDWPGCVGSDTSAPDDLAWVCDERDDHAHLIDVRWQLDRPASVELAEEGLHLDLADTDAAHLAELTAEIACERDAGRPALLALLAGPKLLTALPLHPGVECGQGITGGVVSITTGPDEPADQFKELAEALRSSLEVTPELHTIQVIVPEASQPQD